MKAPKINCTKIHRHNGIKYGYDKKHGWMLWHSDIFGCGWIPCVPRHTK